jgi:hypothetical protein
MSFNSHLKILVKENDLGQTIFHFVTYIQRRHVGTPTLFEHPPPLPTLTEGPLIVPPSTSSLVRQSPHYRCVCFIATRKILGFYISVVNSSR